MISIRCGNGSLIDALKNHGIFVLSNLFTNQALDLLENEFDLLFSQRQNSIEIDDSEGCSKDLRIHHAEENSPLLQEAFCNNVLFNNICETYTGKLGKRKTLINYLKHKQEKFEIAERDGIEITIIASLRIMC